MITLNIYENAGFLKKHIYLLIASNIKIFQNHFLTNDFRGNNVIMNI